jgi:hypothetical protein
MFISLLLLSMLVIGVTVWSSAHVMPSSSLQRSNRLIGNVYDASLGPLHDRNRYGFKIYENEPYLVPTNSCTPYKEYNEGLKRI